MQIYLNDWNLHKQIFEYIWGQSLSEYSNIFAAQSNNNMDSFVKNWRKKTEQKYSKMYFDHIQYSNIFKYQ